ncbi:MAG: hypothetical protein K0R65_343 [Crocinitomicaceae bacterium]|jgi:hypothetical protein|nr:hypothetical protein [Crocinitomicaceae bacterium]
MKRNSLVFGIISGLIISAFMGTSMAIMSCGSSNPDSMNNSMIIGFSAMAVAFSFVFVGIKNFRDKQNGGTITFGKAFLLGLMITFIASTLYVITWGIEFHFFMPDFIDKFAEIQIQQLKDAGMSGAALDQASREMETTIHNYKTNPFYFAMFTYMEILPVGILITLISALILRRKTPRAVSVQ